VETLVDTADVDGDGRVSLADFRRMLPSASEAMAPTSLAGVAGAVAGAGGATASGAAAAATTKPAGAKK